MRSSLAAALLALAPASTAQEALPLFTEPAGAPAVLPEARPGRAIGLDLALLGRSGATLALELGGGPGSETLLARHERTEAAWGGGFVWTGALQGAGDGDVVLSVVGETVFGSIRRDAELWRVRPLGAGAHWLAQIDESAFPACATTGEPRRGPEPSEPSEPGTSGAARAAQEIVDVLVVYSPEAKGAAGGAAAMTALINLAITETNQAYSACGVTQELRLVHAEEMVGYVEPSSFGTILTHLTGKNDGNLDVVHELRDAHGADAVSMLCENGQYCGIAHLMTNVGPAFESQAFNVTNYDCATGYYSFGHELGHNFGSHHDPANAGGAAFPYSYGYRTPSSVYRTILAYSPGTRVKRFSGPASMWNGNVMGNASQDNARSLNETAPTVAAWRQGAPAPSRLAATPLVAGQPVTFGIGGATPHGQVVLAYSLAGGGPTATPYGPAALSAPIQVLATTTVRENGAATFETVVPPGTTGTTVWFQALDLSTGLLGNGISAVVQ